MLVNIRKALYRSLMAASGTLSSLVLSKSHSFLPPISKPNCKSYRNTNLGTQFPSRTQTIKFSVNSEPKNKLTDGAVAEKKSLKVSNGESNNKLGDDPFAVKKSFAVSNGGSKNKLSEDLVAEKKSSEAATGESENKLSDDPVAEKRSLALAFGELFLGIASRLTKRKDGNGSLVSMPVETFEGTEDSEKEAYIKERIASVLEDSVDVPWEQSLKDVEAENKLKKITSPGFSFSAAGLLFPYHLGVAQLLIEKGYIKETTPLAGSSAGAIVCAVVASGSSMQEALKATKVLAEDCRRGGTAFRLEAVLRNVLQDFLPDDVHSRSNGRIRVAITQLLWRPKGLLVDRFDSREDLINAVITSSFIPGYLAPWPATKFRNRLCIDGGLTLFMPPTSAAQTVRVCAFPANQMALKGVEISPHCNPDNRASTRQLFQWALEPADDYILDRLFEFGYLDATVWATAESGGGNNGRPEQPQQISSSE